MGARTLKLEGGNLFPVVNTKFDVASAGKSTYPSCEGSEGGGDVEEEGTGISAVVAETEAYTGVA